VNRLNQGILPIPIIVYSIISGEIEDHINEFKQVYNSKKIQEEICPYEFNTPKALSKK